MLRLIRKWGRVAAIVLLIAGLLVMSGADQGARAAAGINKQISFQGKVVNSNGTNVADNTYTFVFSLYTVDTAGTAVWTETKSIAVVDGIFQTNLGSSTALPGSVDFNSDTLYLGVEFNSDGEMAPRVHLTAVPYAFNSDAVGGIQAADLLRSTASDTFEGIHNRTLTVQSDLTAGNRTANLLSITQANDASYNMTSGALLGITNSDTASAANLLSLSNSGSGAALLFAEGTSVANGIQWGTDTNLYRAAASNLKTDDNLTIAGTYLELLAQADLRYLDSDSTNYVAFQAPATVASDIVWTLPATDVAGCLSSNGSATLSWAACGGSSGAPTTAQYLTLALDSTLSAERVLVGTANQVILNDAGANGNLTLSTPQNIHTAATPQFSSIGLGTAANSLITAYAYNNSYNSASTAYGLFSDIGNVGSGAVYGVQGTARGTVAGTGDLIGVYGAAIKNSAVASVLSNMVGVRAGVTIGTTGSVTTVKSLDVTNPAYSAAGLSTDVFGVYVADITTTGATNKYGLALAGADTQTLWVGSGADNTDAANGIAFGASRDTNLYRSAADTLKTDDGLVVGATLTVGNDNYLSDAGTSSLVLGGDTVANQFLTISRQNAGIDGDMSMGIAVSNSPMFQMLFGGILNGEQAGSATVTNPYLMAASPSANVFSIKRAVKAAGAAFTSSDLVTYLTLASGQLQLPTDGSAGGLLLGGDALLFRSAVDTLRTDDLFYFGAANAADSSANSVTLASTLGIMNGSDTFRGIFLSYTNANHTGSSNIVRGIDIANITGDAEAAENAINIGTGWDYGLATSSPVSNAVVNAAGGSATAMTFSGTLGIFNGSDTFTGLSLEYTNANHTGTSNYFNGIKIGNIVGDAEAYDYAINIGTGWDYGLTTDSPVGVFKVNNAGVSSTGIVVGGSLAAMDGSDTVIGVNLTYVNSNHTGTGNVLTGFNIVNITGDADATETGFSVGTGWDYGLRAALAGTAAIYLSDTGGTSAGGMLMGTDTNWYRGAANELRTDDLISFGSTKTNTVTDFKTYKSDGGMGFIFDTSSTYSTGSLMSVRNNTGAKFMIGATGNVIISGTLTQNSIPADVAENIQISDNSIGGGDIVAIDESNQETARKALASDQRVLGVISTEPGILISGSTNGKPLVLSGRVPVKVVGEAGIRVGDTVVVSDVAGWGTKATDHVAPMVGIALTNQQPGIDTIVVQIQSGLYIPQLGNSIANSALSPQYQSILNTFTILDNNLLRVSDLSVERLQVASLTVSGRIVAGSLDLSDESAGQGVIVAGQTSVFVSTPAVESSDKVLISPIDPGVDGADAASLYRGAIQPGLGFTVKLRPAQSMEYDQTFDWLIVK